MRKCVYPPEFRKRNSQNYEIRNLIKLDIDYKENGKLLVEIETPEVDIYTKDFSFFVHFSKTALIIIIIFFNWHSYINCHKLLFVYYF